MSGNPPTYGEAVGRGLTVEKGIHTFSNGSEWYSWSANNCGRCWFYDENVSGALCAFEAAALMHTASPALALMFGWTEHPDYPGSFVRPDQCAYFRDRERGDGDDNPPPPDPDPAQLVLIADPTEDAAQITQAETPVSVGAA